MVMFGVLFVELLNGMIYCMLGIIRVVFVLKVLSLLLNIGYIMIVVYSMLDGFMLMVKWVLLFVLVVMLLCGVGLFIS